MTVGLHSSLGQDTSAHGLYKLDEDVSQADQFVP